MAVSIDEFLELARGRRSVRSFKSDEVPEELLTKLLEAARWAPSGYNLQPTQMVVVRDAGVKKKLRGACMNQRQIEDAGATVVFLGDRRVADRNFRKMMEHEEKEIGLHPKYKESMEKFVPLAFGTGPLGLGWAWKSLLPVAGLVRPMPELPAVYRRYWLAKQVSLAAMNFMLAAASAGLGTCPMEGFDEGRVRKVLGLSKNLVVVLVVPVGWSKDGKEKRGRLPLEGMVRWV